MTVARFEPARMPALAVRSRRAPPLMAGFAKRMLSLLRQWRRRIKERAELAALDDRTLADIGLSRAEAEFLANKPFWRD